MELTRYALPGKLSILVDALADDAVLAGPADGWFVDLDTGRARPHSLHRHVIFNGLAVRRDALDGVRFQARRRRAEDTVWMAALRRAGCVPVVVAQVLCFWLCHRQNVSNPSRRYVFPHPLQAVRDAIGQEAWSDTDDQLARLRTRLRDS